MKKYDSLIIGGGPGGYVAAIKCAQLGLKTAIVEREKLGGVCLNWGCIPTKSLIRNAEVISLLNEGKTYGFSFDTNTLKVDYSAAQKRSREVSAKLVKGIEYLVKKNNIDLYQSDAKFIDATKIALQTGEIIEATNIIIATGSHPSVIPGFDMDNPNILNSKKALQIIEVPKSVVIIGAGAIGMEFASIWKEYGSDVTIVEMMPDVLPLEDSEISAEVNKHFINRGIKILTSTKVEKVQNNKSGLTVTLSSQNGKEVINCDKVLVSAGIKPNTENIGLEKVGVVTERGFITVNDNMQTNVKGIYAIGDVTGKLALAHVASTQGLIAADTIAGNKTHALKYMNMPKCTYCKPEAASTGLTEKQAKEQGFDVKIGKFPFSANGKAIGLNEPFGFVKIVADSKTDEILGIHMVGPHVTEMIAEATSLIYLECTGEELAHIVHPHPTLSEVVMEAAHVLTGNPIHI